MFKLKENNTTFFTEIMAGFTTFFAMSYIIFVNPAMLANAGTADNPMPIGAVFLATIISAAVGTLIMGLFANVPYAQAPGMGLNAFFTFTVCGMLGFTWQQALAMVFICGIINILITVTKVRKLIIKAIPESLQHAIGGGIGIFIAYIGIKNAGLLKFTVDPGKYIYSAFAGNDAMIKASDVAASGTVIADSSAVPALVEFNNAGVVLALIGIAITMILVVLKLKCAIILGIISTTVIGYFMGIVDVSGISTASVITDLQNNINDLGQTFCVAFGEKGMLSLFNDPAKIPLVLMTIFAFSLSDIFDTIGTFIGTGRRTGIFSEEDQKALEDSKGFKSKMDKALFADSIATSIGAIFGTSNTTTYVESAAGIGVGGRTGLTSVVTGLLFIASAFLSTFVGVVPAQATAPALILIGVMMMASFKEIKWDEIEDAIPAFFASIFMGLCYSISYGIAAGFISYCIVKVFRGKIKEVHPIIWGATLLFVANFVILALIG